MAAITVEDAEAELLTGAGSAVELLAVAVFVIVVPTTVEAATLKTSVNVADVPEVSVASVQLTVPVAPTAGFAQMNDGPVFWASETKRSDTSDALATADIDTLIADEA